MEQIRISIPNSTSLKIFKNLILPFSNNSNNVNNLKGIIFLQYLMLA